MLERACAGITVFSLRYSRNTGQIRLAATIYVINPKRLIMKNTFTRLTLATTTVVAAVTLVACGGGGGGGGSPAPAPGPAMGTLGAAITDAPACGFDAVNVTVSKFRVNKNAAASDTDAGWSEIVLSPARKINLLNLTNGVIDSLGTTALEAGTYTQMRLVLDPNTGNGMANTVVRTGTTTEVTLDTPSAVQSGIKLNANVEVLAGQRADVVLDFDACKSVVARGNGQFALKPVVKVIPTILNGISGYVAPALLTNAVQISAQQNGSIIASTVPNTTTGEFFLARLPVGSYDVVVTANGRATSVVGAVPVASSTSNTVLSTAAAPLTMVASTSGSISGTATLNPASTVEAAYVAARQSFAAGPTVTVRYVGANLSTGAYTIANLPLTAPQYASYSATLPLVFANAATVTPGPGIYNVSASATGYTTFQLATPVNITTASAVNVNFTLVP